MPPSVSGQRRAQRMRQSAIYTATTAALTQSRPTPVFSGPPTSFETLFTWTLVSVLAYVCFIRLPGRLHPYFNMVTMSHTSFNDFAWAAHALNWAMWLWPAYDILWRVACLVCLPVEGLEKLAFAFSRTQSKESSPTLTTGSTSLVLPDGFLSMVDNLRVILRGDSLFEDLLNGAITDATEEQEEGGGNDSGFPSANASSPAARLKATYTLIVMGCSCFLLLCITLRAYWKHCRPYLAGKLPEQNLTMRDPETGDQIPMPRQHRIRVSLIPTRFWVELWALCFATAFAYVRAMSLLTGMVYPVCVCLLLAMEILIP